MTEGSDAVTEQVGIGKRASASAVCFCFVLLCFSKFYGNYTSMSSYTSRLCVGMSA